VDVIVLVGGQGTRLRPLTAHRHKSLVPVLNRPFIEYVFDWIVRSGFERTILALGRDNEDLVEYAAARRRAPEVIVVEERERLESGGAIRNAVRAAKVEGRFAVLNGDVFVDFAFGPALAAHERASADLTLALFRVEDPSSFGVAVVDKQGLITGFVEKPPPGEAPSDLVNAGAWIFEPGLVDEIPPGAVRVEETLFPSLVARRRHVLGYRFEGLWADIGTPGRYLDLNCALVQRLPGARAVADDVQLGREALVAGAVIGAGSSIGDGARVERSVLWERVEVGPGATVANSVLADGVRVGEGARVEGTTAGRGASIGAGGVVRAGTRIEPGTHYDGSHGS
jgi:mannose-1-phosphate guanylyltransferase